MSKRTFKATIEISFDDVGCSLDYLVNWFQSVVLDGSVSGRKEGTKYTIIEFTETTPKEPEIIKVYSVMLDNKELMECPTLLGAMKYLAGFTQQPIPEGYKLGDKYNWRYYTVSICMKMKGVQL